MYSLSVFRIFVLQMIMLESSITIILTSRIFVFRIHSYFVMSENQNKYFPPLTLSRICVRFARCSSWRAMRPRTWRWSASRPGIYSWLSVVTRNWTAWSRRRSPAAASFRTFTSRWSARRAVRNSMRVRDSFVNGGRTRRRWRWRRTSRRIYFINHYFYWVTHTHTCKHTDTCTAADSVSDAI